MLTSIPYRVSLLIGLGIAVVLLCEGCGGERYKTVVDAAESGLSSLTMEEQEIKLKRTYAQKLEKVLPYNKVARYIQIENKIRAVIKMELAQQIPLAY